MLFDLAKLVPLCGVLAARRLDSGISPCQLQEPICERVLVDLERRTEISPNPRGTKRPGSPQVPRLSATLEIPSSRAAWLPPSYTLGSSSRASCGADTSHDLRYPPEHHVCLLLCYSCATPVCLKYAECALDPVEKFRLALTHLILLSAPPTPSVAVGSAALRCSPLCLLCPQGASTQCCACREGLAEQSRDRACPELLGGYRCRTAGPRCGTWDLHSQVSTSLPP